MAHTLTLLTRVRVRRVSLSFFFCVFWESYLVSPQNDVDPDTTYVQRPDTVRTQTHTQLLILPPRSRFRASFAAVGRFSAITPSRLRHPHSARCQLDWQASPSGCRAARLVIPILALAKLAAHLVAGRRGMKV